YNVYDNSQSSTYESNGMPFSIAYEDGSYAEGIFDNDTVTYQTVGDEVPLFFNMWAQGLISSPIFSFYLNPLELESTAGGELILGGIDTTKFQGSLTYVPVSIQGEWDFVLTSVVVNNQAVSTNSIAIADTGTSLIVGPYLDVQALNKEIGAVDVGYEYYIVDCHNRSLSSFPIVTFTIGDKTFDLSALQYILFFQYVNYPTVCVSAFQASDSYIWILGDIFLTRFYSVFDIQNNQLGFAKSISYNEFNPVDPDLFPGSTSTLILTSTSTKKAVTNAANSWTFGSKIFSYQLYIVLLLYFSNMRNVKTKEHSGSFLSLSLIEHHS
ncbi:unnamed protein product, partial [Didymodactylos carnosus]